VRMRKLIRSNGELLPRSFLWMLACAACILAMPADAQQAQSGARELVLTVGKSLVVNSSNTIERVAVGFGDIAEARAVEPKEVLLSGKAPGETSLIIWQQGGSMLYFDVVVRPNTTAARTRLEDLQRRIQEELSGQSINVSMTNDQVFLRGSVKDLGSAERAEAIAATAGKVVDLLYVPAPPTDAQILLRVQFATLDRRSTNELGLNLVSTGIGNVLGSVTTGQFSPPSLSSLTSGAPVLNLGGALNVFMFSPGLNLAGTLKALETRGLAEILAEPNVLAINGKPASFLSGGEFPYPILQGGGFGLGTVTVAFREFGVRINFLPLITPRGTIRLAVAPEVSSLDFTNGLNVGGVTVPGLASRKLSTEIELKAGQSFAIGGLLDKRLAETMQRIPLLADIPLLGKLFQSRSLTKENNELLVIITPEIVQPIPAGQAPPQLAFPKPPGYPGAQDDPLPRTPGTNVTGESLAPAADLIPVEVLRRKMKTENDLKLPQQGGSFGSQPMTSGTNPLEQSNPAPVAK
jgi:pilus assembly protein CpaC